MRAYMFIRVVEAIGGVNEPCGRAEGGQATVSSVVTSAACCARIYVCYVYVMRFDCKKGIGGNESRAQDESPSLHSLQAIRDRYFNATYQCTAALLPNDGITGAYVIAKCTFYSNKFATK